MPLPQPDFSLALREAALRQIEAAATSDPSPAVRARCAEIAALMAPKGRKALLTAQSAIARNTANTDEDRCRALDVIYQLIRP